MAMVGTRGRSGLHALRSGAWRGCVLTTLAVCTALPGWAASEFDRAYLGWEAAVVDRDAPATLRHAERAYRLGLAEFGPDHENTAILEVNLADAHVFAGDHDAAESHYRHALPTLERTRDPDHADLLLPVGDLAFIYQRRGQTEAARAYHRRAMRIIEKSRGPRSREAATQWVNLAVFEDAAGNPTLSRSHHERALEIRRAILPSNAAELGESLFFVAKHDLEAGRHEAARDGYRSALRIWRNRKPSDSRIEPAARAQLAHAKARIRASAVEPSELLDRVNPRYPQRMAKQGVSGWVEVEYTVAADGSVVDVVVVGSDPASGFHNAAIRAVSQWRYEPRKVGGKPVEDPGKRAVIRFNVDG